MTLRERRPRTPQTVLRSLVGRRGLLILAGWVVLATAVFAVCEALGAPDWAPGSVLIMIGVPLLQHLLAPGLRASRPRDLASAPDDVGPDAVRSLLARTPPPDRARLRHLAWATLGSSLIGLAVVAFLATVVVDPGVVDDTQPPSWLLRTLASLVAAGMVGYVVVALGPRRYRQGRAVVREVEAGTAPRRVAVVVGEQGEQPVLRLLDGSHRHVVLQADDKVVRRLDQADVVVLDGRLRSGRLVAVSAGGRQGWTRVRSGLGACEDRGEGVQGVERDPVA